MNAAEHAREALNYFTQLDLEFWEDDRLVPTPFLCARCKCGISIEVFEHELCGQHWLPSEGGYWVHCGCDKRLKRKERDDRHARFSRRIEIVLEPLRQKAEELHPEGVKQ